MKVGDLVRLTRKDWGEPVGIVTEEGMAASSGVLWGVGFEDKLEPAFEDELEVVSESR